MKRAISAGEALAQLERDARANSPTKENRAIRVNEKTK